MAYEHDQLAFYNEEDIQMVSKTAYRWGMFAGVVSTLFVLGSILAIGWYFDI